MTSETAVLGATSGPWYREPWPWIIMSGPAIVVVAGIATLVIAITSSDGLVSDDYYKAGFTVNQDVRRDRAAAEGHYQAQVMFAQDGGRVRVILAGAELPGEIRLRLTHRTRAGADQSVGLAKSGGGIYEGTLRVPAGGVWTVMIEGPEWRLSGTWHAGRDAVAQLTPR